MNEEVPFSYGRSDSTVSCQHPVFLIIGVSASSLERRDLVVNHSIHYFCHIIAFYFLVVHKIIMVLIISSLVDSMKHDTLKKDLKVIWMKSIQKDRVKDLSGLSILAI